MKSIQGLEANIYFESKKDFEKTQTAKNQIKVQYPKPDNKMTFDILTNVSRSNIHHDENQPCHLKVKDKELPLKSFQKFDGIEN